LKTIDVSTETNDLESIIRLLSPTLEYVADDGYFGVLTLDVSSIRIESQGTTSSNFTQTVTREFPHLSNSDTSLVPRTVSENGRTYNLTDVQWRTQSSNAVDHTQVANRFTAVATYSRTATRTATIGYTTTAEYRGTISRIASGRTEFTAQFIGIPIVIPIVNQPQPATTNGSAADEREDAEPVQPEPTPEPEPEPTRLTGPAVVENVTVEQVHIGGIVIEVEREVPQPEPDAQDENPESDGGAEVEGDGKAAFPIINIFTGLMFAGGLVRAYFIGKKGKAMLGILSKTSCLLLVVMIVFGAGALLFDTETVHAATLPGYSFGLRGAAGKHEQTVSACRTSDITSATQAGTGTADIQVHRASSGVVHYDMRVLSDIEARASPAINLQQGRQFHFAPGYHNGYPRGHGYVYGETIGTLTVERLGRTVTVIAGATDEAMEEGAGHFSFTGLNQGNTGLIGHNRGRNNGHFSFVRELVEGDILTLEAAGVTRAYTVSSVYYVDETDFSPLMELGDTRLTLVTCREDRPGERRIAKALEVSPSGTN
jgi:LPXTG-site transpeptidase (sortase) family protein